MNDLKPAYWAFIFIFVHVIIFSIEDLAFAKDISWQLTQQTENLWVWKLKDAKGVIGTLQTSSQSQPINLKEMQTENFLEKFKASRQEALKLIGITRWTTSHYKWQKKSDHYELKLNGTYRNAQNHLIRFYETHLFYKQKTHQILFSYPSQTPINRNIASQFMKKARGVIQQ